MKLQNFFLDYPTQTHAHLLSDGTRTELLEYIKHHEDMPAFKNDYRVLDAKLRLARHQIAVIQRELYVQTVSFISLADLERCAYDHLFNDGWTEAGGQDLKELEAMDCPEEALERAHVGGTFVTNAPAVCELLGHDVYDCSSAGPESGNMDHACRRCGRYFSVPLY